MKSRIFNQEHGSLSGNEETQKPIEERKKVAEMFLWTVIKYYYIEYFVEGLNNFMGAINLYSFPENYFFIAQSDEH